MTPRELADDLLDAVLTASPLSASLLGLPGYDDRLDDLSADAAARAAERYDAIASAAAAIPVDGLGRPTGRRSSSSGTWPPPNATPPGWVRSSGP